MKWLSNYQFFFLVFSLCASPSPSLSCLSWFLCLAALYVFTSLHLIWLPWLLDNYIYRCLYVCLNVCSFWCMHALVSTGSQRHTGFVVITIIEWNYPLFTFAGGSNSMSICFFESPLFWNYCKADTTARTTYHFHNHLTDRWVQNISHIYI